MKKGTRTKTISRSSSVGWEVCRNDECTEEVIRVLDVVKKVYSNCIYGVTVP